MKKLIAYLMEEARTENFDCLSFDKSVCVKCVNDFEPISVLTKVVSYKDVKFVIELVIGVDKINRPKMALFGYYDKIIFDKSQLIDNPLDLFHLLRNVLNFKLNAKDILNLVVFIQDAVQEALVIWNRINNNFLFWQVREGIWK